MRHRRFLFVCALVLVMPLIELDQTVAQEMEKRDANRSEKILGTDSKATGAETTEISVPVPTPLQIERKDTVYTSAYKDAYHILSSENPCSVFFGGPTKAV